MRRRRFLKASSASLAALLLEQAPMGNAVTLSPLEERLATWESFGWHWTGSQVQEKSADWIAQQASTAGMRCEIQPFTFQRADVGECFIQSAEHRALALPVFNHAGTPPEGLTGVLAVAPDQGDFVLLSLAPQARLEDALTKAQADKKEGPPYRAAVIVTTGAAAGLAPLDIGSRSMPLPVIEVSSDALPWLTMTATAKHPVTILARLTLSDGTGRNVVAVHSGEDQTAAPIVISTGYSGWGPCTGERGGPLCIWLQIAAGLANTTPQRGVVMVATDGEELGRLGRSAFLGHFTELAANTPMWLELGANLGARDSTLQLVAEDSPLATVLARRMTLEGLKFDRRSSAPEEVPTTGKAGIALRASAAPQFHLPGDQLPTSTDLRKLGALGAALARGVAEISAG